MSGLGRCLLLLVSLVLLTATVVRGQPPRADAKKPDQSKETIRTDRYGDPLPEGALRRLGTVRLRHGDTVNAVAFCADDRILALASDDGTVRLWDVTTGKEIRRLPWDEGPIKGLASSADGKRLAACGDDSPEWRPGGGTICLWDPATGKELLTIPGYRSNAVALSADGKLLAAGVKFGLCRVWNTDERNALCNFGDNKENLAVSFSPDARLIASSTASNSFHITDLATGKPVVVRPCPSVGPLSFSPDGRLLASGGGDYLIRLWDTSHWREVRHFSSPARWVMSLAFSRDGKLLVSGHMGRKGGDAPLSLWDTATGKEIRQFHGHLHPVRSVAISRDSRLLASGSDDATVRLWQVATGKAILPDRGQQGPVTCLAFSADGRILASGSSDRTARLWDVSTGTERCAPFRYDHDVTSVGLSADGQALLLVVTGGNVVDARDVSTGKSRWVFGVPEPLQPARVAFSPNNVHVAVGHARGLQLLDGATDKKRWSATPGEVRTLAFGPGGEAMACLCVESTGRSIVWLYDVATGTEHANFVLPEGWGTRVLYAPDGRTLATLSQAGAIQVWETATGKLCLELRGHRWQTFAAAFSPGGRVLASGGNDRLVRFWDLSTGEEIGQRAGHQGPVEALAFAPDGKVLASGGRDSTILLWGMEDRLRGQRPHPRQLAAKELDACWEKLKGDNAAQAYRAVWTLAAAPGQTVPFLKERLRPKAPASPEHVARLIADLDDGTFAVRVKASRALEELGELAAPALRKALEEQSSAEIRVQARRLLEKLPRKALSPLELRQLRAVAVLEYGATPEAQELLQALARGAPAARLTREANASLERLARSPGGTP
jgi:WD40 repeat protein